MQLKSYLRVYAAIGLTLIILSSDTNDKGGDLVRKIPSRSEISIPPVREDNVFSYYMSNEKPRPSVFQNLADTSYKALEAKNKSNSYVYKPSKTTEN